MAGFLGTLFTGRVALNLALPDRQQFGRATTLFGKGIEQIMAVGSQREKNAFDNRATMYKGAVENIQKIRAEAALGDKDALRNEMKAANKVIADELKWGEGQLKKWASFQDWSREMGGRGYDAFGMGEMLAGYAGDDLNQAFGDVERYEATFARFTQNIDNFYKESVGRFRQGLYDMTFALVGFYYSLNQVTNTFREFEEELINAQSIFQTTWEELYSVSDQLIDFTTKYGISVGETTKVLYQMASAGLNAAESQKILNDVLKLSMAVQGDSNTLGKLTIQTLKGFGLQMEESSELTDKFAHTINMSLIEWQDLASAVKFAMPFYVATGQSVDQLLGSIQILTDRALEAGIAGRGLRQAMAEFAEGAGDATTKFAEMGVTVTDSEGNMLQLTEIAKNFSNVIGTEVANDTELLTTLLEDLNVRGATAFIHLVQNADEFGAAVDDLQNAAGSATRMADVQQKSLNRQIQLVKNALLAPFLMSEEMYVAEGYINSFHKALHDSIQTFADFIYNVGPDGQTVLTEFGFTLRDMAIKLLNRLTDSVSRLVDVFLTWHEAGVINLDLLKLYFYPLNTVIYLMELWPDSLGQIALGLYLMNKFLPITHMWTLLMSDTLWEVVKAAYAKHAALSLLGGTLAAIGISALIVGKIFDVFGGKIAAIVTGIMVLVAAVMMFKAALNPADAALSFKALVATGAAVGAVAMTMYKSLPQADPMDIDTAYSAYLAEAEGAGAIGVGGGGGGNPTAQTLIVDRATFRSDNLSEVDYDSIMRS
tara:strand:+ start:5392 stop:7695 length:2304 start_codon:yes stop_codon:yes gene_type:complete